MVRNEGRSYGLGMKGVTSATYEVEEELFKTNGQMTFQIIALDFVYSICVANHHYEIPDIMIRSERVPCQKKDLTSCKMLIEGIPELTRCREKNEMLTQIIAIHSLFKSFQNTVIDDSAFLLPSWKIMESSSVSCEEKDANCQNLLFLGMIFDILAFYLTVFAFVFFQIYLKKGIGGEL